MLEKLTNTTTSHNIAYIFWEKSTCLNSELYNLFLFL